MGKNLYDIEWTSVKCSTWLAIHRWIHTHNEIMWKILFCTSLRPLSLARPPQLPTSWKKKFSLRWKEFRMQCHEQIWSNVEEERQKLKVDRMGNNNDAKIESELKWQRKKCSQYSRRAGEFFVYFSSSSSFVPSFPFNFFPFLSMAKKICLQRAMGCWLFLLYLVCTHAVFVFHFDVSCYLMLSWSHFLSFANFQLTY